MQEDIPLFPSPKKVGPFIPALKERSFLGR
jgi:hypothetical protein